MERTEPAWLCIDDGQKEIEIDIILTNLRIIYNKYFKRIKIINDNSIQQKWYLYRRCTGIINRKQFIIIKREDNGKDINRNGFVSVLFFITK